MEKLEEEKETRRQMLKYFWEEKGRCNGFTNCDIALTENPEIKAAWENYKLYEKTLDVLIKNL